MIVPTDILDILIEVSSIICILPFIVSIVRYKYLPNYLISIFILMVVSVVVEIINNVCEKYNIPNSNILNFYTLIEFTLMIFFYIRFFKSRLDPKFFYGTIPVLYCASLMDFIRDGFYSGGSFPTTIESVVLILCALFFFYYVLQHLLFENLLKEPAFWINTAIIVYFSGNLFFFAFNSYMTKIDPLAKLFLWSGLHSFFNIFFNILLTIGFWKVKAE